MGKIVVFSSNDLFAGRALKKSVEAYPECFQAIVYADDPFSTFKKRLFILENSGLRYIAFQAFNKIFIKNAILLFSRFHRFGHPLVSQLAKRHKIKVIRVDKINSKSAEESLLHMEPDIILSIQFPQVMRENILKIPKIGAINIHKSLLPKYRGMNPIFWAMLKGEKEIGVTAHFMEKSIDSGEIIDQRSIPVSPSDSLFSLNNKCAEAASGLIYDLVTCIYGGNEVHSYPQNTQQASYFSLPTKREVREFKRKKMKFLF